MLCSACTNIFNGTDEPWYQVKGRNGTVPAFMHHPSPSQLKVAAAEGCYICGIIWRKLTREEKWALSCTWSNQYLHRASQAIISLFRLPVAHYSWSPMSYPSIDEVGIRFQFGGYPFWKRITFRMQSDSNPDENQLEQPAQEVMSESQRVISASEASFDSVLRDDTFSMWSPRVKSLMQRWYDECTHNHTDCCLASNRTVDFHPTRILYIKNDIIRLDVYREQRCGQRYATLSHRWNAEPGQMPTLTEDNLSRMCQKVDESCLTPTFRDAIKVCKLLQIDYLWIDSLCIMQSGPQSDQDWQKESAVMGDIYQNAYLNIQAGRDHHDAPFGLFITRKPRNVAPFKVSATRQFDWPDAHRWKGCHETHFTGDFCIVDEDFARDELLGAAINQRGWVLQEHLLSHRILHFGAQQVFWECHQVLACETFPKGIPQTIPNTLARAPTEVIGSFDRLKLFEKRATGRIPSPNFRVLSVRPGFLAWWYVVELYSTCSLTRNSDKLVAISGLAKIFGMDEREDRASDILKYLLSLIIPRSGDITQRDSLNLPHGISGLGTEYFAGLWGSELIPCLLWHVINGRQANGNQAKRLEGPRAPSWSWASINGLLHASIYQNWQDIPGTELVEIIHASTELVSANNESGQVSGGQLLLRGSVIHERDISWPEQEEVKISAHTSEVHAGMVRKIKLNSASVASLRVLRTEVLCYMDDIEEFHSRRRRSGVSFEIALLPLIGLQRRRETWSTREGYIDEIYEYHGLVIALKTQTWTGIRLGYFRVQDKDVFGPVLARSGKYEITVI